MFAKKKMHISVRRRCIKYGDGPTIARGFSVIGEQRTQNLATKVKNCGGRVCAWCAPRFKRVFYVRTRHAYNWVTSNEGYSTSCSHPLSLVRGSIYLREPKTLPVRHNPPHLGHVLPADEDTPFIGILPITNKDLLNLGIESRPIPSATRDVMSEGAQGAQSESQWPSPLAKPLVDEPIPSKDFYPVTEEDLSRLGIESRLIPFVVKAASQIEQSSYNPPTLTASEAKDFVEVFDKVRPSAGSPGCHVLSRQLSGRFIYHDERKLEESLFQSTA